MKKYNFTTKYDHGMPIKTNDCHDANNQRQKRHFSVPLTFTFRKLYIPGKRNDVT